jgi:ATP-binding cassette subfamily B protein
VVLEGGRVRATGVHRDLMEHDELYRRLAGSQLHAGTGYTAPTAAAPVPMEPWSPPPAIAIGWPAYAGLTDQTVRLRPIRSEEQW